MFGEELYRRECFGYYPDSVRRKPVLTNLTGRDCSVDRSCYMPVEELEKTIDIEKLEKSKQTVGKGKVLKK